MSKKFTHVRNLIFFVCLFSFLINLDCWAKTTTAPVVVRKKVVQAKSNDTEQKKLSRSKPFIKGAPPAPKSDTSPPTEIPSEIKRLASTRQSTNKLQRLYDPKGKIDPFEPLIKETPKAKDNAFAHAETIKKPKTDLEKVDLSQLTLTGIILASSGNMGLVQEASSKGYIVTTGTAIGRHGGRVAHIQKDRIIVEEKMKDVYGNIHVQEKELKLNKKI